MATLALTALSAVAPELSAVAGAAGAGIAVSTPTILSALTPSFGTLFSLGGSVLQAVSGSNQAKATEQAAAANQVQLNNKANADAASGERAQEQQLQKTKMVQSRATALAAASGGGASDPTVLNLVGDIGAQGEYNAAMELYNGQSRATTDINQGQNDVYEAQQKAAQLRTRGYGAFLGSKTADTLLDKYG